MPQLQDDRLAEEPSVRNQATPSLPAGYVLHLKYGARKKMNNVLLSSPSSYQLRRETFVDVKFGRLQLDLQLVVALTGFQTGRSITVVWDGALWISDRAVFYTLNRFVDPCQRFLGEESVDGYHHPAVVRMLRARADVAKCCS